MVRSAPKRRGTGLLHVGGGLHPPSLQCTTQDQLLVEINRLNSTGETRNCGFVFPETSTNLDTKQLRSRLEYLHDAVEYYIPPGMEMVARKISSDFYNNVLVPLSEVGRWNFSLPLISTNPALLVEPDYNFDFQEEHSDACIAELTMAKKKAECNTSGDCIWRMTLKNATSYWLTHEVFFMFIAYNSPCFDDILQILGGLRRGDLQDFLRHACTNTLRDAELIARLGFPSEHQDLFIEQSTFCGLAGVEEFFRPEWVRLVYSWRRPDNCYEEEPAHPANEKTRHTRRKRYDVTTPDRCRVHKTILAAMYTTTVLRFLLH
ncbi:UPF0764 protein C16orf89 homolog isoform X2 [Ornithodoros turicata]|uniref:UPF0764 protein C16orf89 homolog isoform X2 n=1 Tax=Ornithodoros turicata TaxID=34597 RepID=UPI00313A1C4A